MCRVALIAIAAVGLKCRKLLLSHGIMIRGKNLCRNSKYNLPFLPVSVQDIKACIMGGNRKLYIHKKDIAFIP